MDRLRNVALGSLAVNLVVLAIKSAAFLLTGSVALYSIAARPPDEGHPYGHHKAEYLSAVVVGALIMVAALAILREAYLGFLAPKLIDAPWAGLAVSAAAPALNAAWSAMLIRQSRLQAALKGELQRS